MRTEAFQLLDLMNDERTSPVGLAVYKRAQASGMPEKDLVSFGANVYTYIQLANSNAGASSEIRAKLRRQWPSKIAKLFNRLDQDGVVPDMRFLLNVAGAAAWELGDFNLSMAAIQRAHMIAQVPRRKLPLTEGAVQPAPTRPQFIPLQPPTNGPTPPDQLLAPPPPPGI